MLGLWHSSSAVSRPSIGETASNISWVTEMVHKIPSLNSETIHRGQKLFFRERRSPISTFAVDLRLIVNPV